MRRWALAAACVFMMCHAQRSRHVRDRVRRDREASAAIAKARAKAKTATKAALEGLGETGAAPRAGTLCKLVEREVLVEADLINLAVHRLRFALPSTFSGLPECCGGASGVAHVTIRGPDRGDEQIYRYYTATLLDGCFEVIVKIYRVGGVSEYLGRLQIGASAHARPPAFGTRARARTVSL